MFETNRETKSFARAELTKQVPDFSEAIFDKAWAKWVRFANNYNSPHDMACEQGAETFSRSMAAYYTECLNKSDGLGTANRDIAVDIRRMHSVKPKSWRF